MPEWGCLNQWSGADVVNVECVVLFFSLDFLNLKINFCSSLYCKCFYEGICLVKYG